MAVGGLIRLRVPVLQGLNPNRRPAAGHHARQAAVAAAHVEDARAREVKDFRDDVTVVLSHWSRHRPFG